MKELGNVWGWKLSVGGSQENLQLDSSEELYTNALEGSNTRESSGE
jgi:hypothetical protein